MITCPTCGVAIRYEYEVKNHIAQMHTDLFTVDHVKIYDGMPVWDNNLDVVKVDLSHVSPEPNGDVWFATKKTSGLGGGLINGERCVTRHPSTRQTAASAWIEATQPVSVTVDLTWPDGSQFTWSGISEDLAQQLTELLGHDYDMKV